MNIKVGSYSVTRDKDGKFSILWKNKPMNRNLNTDGLAVEMFNEIKSLEAATINLSQINDQLRRELNKITLERDEIKHTNVA